MYVVFISLSLICLGLIAFGWRGTREGDAPHCRRCEYNLTGNETGQCPECGRPLDQGVVYGERHRHKLSVVLGLLGLLIIGGYTYIEVRRSSIMPLLPSSMVSFFARHGSTQALDEVVARIGKQSMVVEESLLLWALDALMDRAASSAKSRERLHELLEYAWRNNTLYGHEPKYCNALVEQASMRTEYVLDGDVVLNATVFVRIPFSAPVFTGTGHFRVRFDDESVRIETQDGRDTKSSGVAHYQSHWGRYEVDHQNRFAVPYVFHEGEYEITYTANVSFTLVRPDSASVDCARPVELHANVSAAPIDDDNPDSEDIAEFIMREVFITQTERSFGEGLRNYRSMAFTTRCGIPASFAFEVFAVSGGKNTLIGFVCAARGSTALVFAASTAIVEFEGREFDLQLRFSRDAARKCKVPNPWVGEADLGPFHLKPLAPEMKNLSGSK